MSKVKNAFFNIFGSDRHCSNCKNLEERINQLDNFLISSGIRSGFPKEPRHYDWCTINNRQIKNKETENCVSFKRKYGSTPILQEIHGFEQFLKKQWKLHYKIITFSVATTISIIAVLVSIFH